MLPRFRLAPQKRKATRAKPSPKRFKIHQSLKQLLFIEILYTYEYTAFVDFHPSFLAFSANGYIFNRFVALPTAILLRNRRENSPKELSKRSFNSRL